MTVSYRKDCVTGQLLGGNLFKLLFRWKGSVYRLIWPDLLCFIIIYYALSAIYRAGLGPDEQKIFEDVVKHCAKFMNMVPLSWILGFFVGLVVNRWWAQYQSIPWPDTLSFIVHAGIPDNDSVSRKTRRTIVRYVNLAITMTLLKMLDPNHNPYKDKESLISEGLLTENEKEILENFESKTKKCRNVDNHSTMQCCECSFVDWWIPLTWAMGVVRKARNEEQIKSDRMANTINGEIIKLRSSCGSLLSYDWINVPLVYTQVVTIALYSFFLTSLMGRQFTKTNDVDFYVPIFTILQFIFYVGWLKVAEALMNPFGEDDDDFEILYLIKRNKEAAYLIVDDMHVDPPEPQEDKFWDKEIPNYCGNDDQVENIEDESSILLKVQA
ncbi:unnamed protein product [Meganyctiphanes norvegica]|uniref:Bestrophin homolog n=1 Tax=Meganyctiphanes norvegica TaxID=48144 RepID=A0AAV2Q442_MEGNR